MDKRLQETFKKYFHDYKLKEFEKGQYLVIDEIGTLSFTFNVNEEDESVYSVKTLESTTFANYYTIKHWYQFLREYEEGIKYE